jgi:drug/metabolite transporter (DMT)-like permease
MADASLPPETPARGLAGRLCILAAAMMWSSGGFFAKNPTFDEWPRDSRGLLLAFWRALFAGLLVLPAVRRPRWRVRLAPMAASFTLMNVTYLSAMTLTTAANAIWLQSTAPFWIFAATLGLGAEAVNRRDLLPLACGVAGIGTILWFEIGGQAQAGIACGLAAGVFYAGVVLSIRGLRTEDPAWLVAVNHLVAALALFPFVLYLNIWPSPRQLAVLAGFGLLQMGLPYLLFTRGLQTVSSQEASLIALCEPVLVPLWVYLAWAERPDWWTLAGGGLILAGLVARYARPEARRD